MKINPRRRQLVKELEDKTPLSGALYSRAKLTYAGGAVGGSTHQNPWPIYMARGDHALIYDVDDNEYIDCCLGKGALLLGHNHPGIRQAVTEQAHMGLMHSAPFKSQVDFAEKISPFFYCTDVMFLCNSGTEAVHKAIMMARAHTQKNKIAKFEGCYHGTYDQSCISVFASGADEIQPVSTPNIAGVPQRAIEDTLVLPFNHRAAFDLIHKHADELAAVIVEPVATIGLFPMSHEFMAELRDLTRHKHIPLVFDEVLTGFRVGRGGCQSIYGVVPDIAAYGKALGGGMPIGAVGCKPNIVKNRLNATPPLRLGGTFSGNPMSLAAANAFLDLVTKDDTVFSSMDKTCADFSSFLNAKITAKGYPVHVSSCGSMFFVHIAQQTPHSPRDIKNELMDKHDELCLRLRLKGVYIEPAHAGFISPFHTGPILDTMIQHFWESIQACFDPSPTSNDFIQ